MEPFVFQGLGCLDLQFTNRVSPFVKECSLQNLCRFPVRWYSRIDISQTAIAQQNEGSLTGEALLKHEENTLGSKKRDGNIVYKLALLSKSFAGHNFQL